MPITSCSSISQGAAVTRVGLDGIALIAVVAILGNLGSIDRDPAAEILGMSMRATLSGWLEELSELSDRIAPRSPPLAPAKPPSSLALIFLDVDGVIDARRVGLICPTKLARLRSAVSATPDCAVVISSHWRLVPKQHAALVACLRAHRIPVIGATPSPYRPWDQKRPLEIAIWLESYHGGCAANSTPPVRAYAALDDRDLLSDAGGDILRGRFVRTNKAHGLSDRDVVCMRRIISTQHSGTPRACTSPSLRSNFGASLVAYMCSHDTGCAHRSPQISRRRPVRNPGPR